MVSLYICEKTTTLACIIDYTAGDHPQAYLAGSLVKEANILKRAHTLGVAPKCFGLVHLTDPEGMLYEYALVQSK